MAESDVVLPTVADQREFLRIRKKVDGLSGTGLTNSPTGIAIGGNSIRNFRQRGLQEPILVTITSTGSSGATWKQLVPPTDAAAAALMDGGLTNEDIGVAFEVNGNTASTMAGSGTTGAHVWLFFRTQADGTVVPCYEVGGGSTDYLQNVTTNVGTFDTLNMHSTLADVYKFQSVAASGTNHARADLKLNNPGNAYEVMQMDSTAAKLVILPVRAIP